MDEESCPLFYGENFSTMILEELELLVIQRHWQINGYDVTQSQTNIFTSFCRNVLDRKGLKLISNYLINEVRNACLFYRRSVCKGKAKILWNFHPNAYFVTRSILKKIIKNKTLTNCQQKVGDRSTPEKTIHRAVVLQEDDKIIKLCENYNFLAAEAKYHLTCCKEFTRPPKPLSPNSKELTVYEEKYLYAENDTFKNYWNIFVMKSLQKLGWLRWCN